MVKYKFLFILFFLVVLVFGLFIWQYFDLKDNKISTPSANTVSKPPSSPVLINYSNMENELSKNSIVQAIPQGSEFLLRFYNFSSGERQWEKSFALSSTDVREITDVSNFKADIILTLDSKYLKSLTNNNFCQIIQSANENGELGFETELSSVALAWKFKSLYSYKSCFGM